MMTPNELLNTTINDLDDLKARHVQSLPVSHFTPLTDFMVIASGTSSRHVKSIADKLVRNMKSRHVITYGIESDSNSEWVLVNLGDVIVHIMQPETREFYNLEKLWSPPAQAHSILTS